MQANYIQRIRLTFTKQGPARFIGHLDVARTLERSINRAEIPIAYTQGFNRRPRLSIAAALPLGYTSDYELADIWLAEETPPSTVQEMLQRGSAPGLEITQARDVPISEPSLQSQLASATYQAQLIDAIEYEIIQRKVDDIVNAQSIIRTRKRKKGEIQEYDLRLLIISLEVLAEEQMVAPVIMMHLQHQVGKMGRPDDVLQVLGYDPLAARINRTHIHLINDREVI